MITIRPFELADQPAVIALWEQCKLWRRGFAAGAMRAP